MFDVRCFPFPVPFPISRCSFFFSELPYLTPEIFQRTTTRGGAFQN